jgi:aspartate kinase
VDIITQSQSEAGQRLAFSVTQEDYPLAESVLKNILPKDKLSKEVMSNVSKISVVGVGMRNHPGVAARFFSVLAENNIQVHLVTTSEIKISAVIDESNLKVAAQALHHSFALDHN